jgi:protoporphyrinogen oxidase
VGGGVTGLAAARDLQRSESPLRTRVSVLEAAPRLGGKIRTESRCRWSLIEPAAVALS